MKASSTCWGGTVLVGIALAMPTSAQTSGPRSEGDYVSREEYNSLRDAFDDLKAELQGVTAHQNAQPASGDAGWLNAERTRFHMELIEEMSDHLRYGESAFMASGYAFTRVVDRDGEDPMVSLVLAPVLLWEVNDRLLFEAEIEFAVVSGEEESETEVELEYAQGSYIVSDYVTVGAGKFLTPFGVFAERLHPAWINKLPDMPLPLGHDGLVPMTSVGGYVRGGFPMGDSKGNYAFYVSTGPELMTEGHHGAPGGGLNFERFNSFRNVAVGGRVGYLPVPQFEVGGSFYWGEATPGGSEYDVDAFIYGLDANYTTDVEFLGGIIDLRCELIFSDVDDFGVAEVHHDEDEGEADHDEDEGDHDEDEGEGGHDEDEGEGGHDDDDDDESAVPSIFDNSREGGYFQLAYRPTHSNIKVLQNLELVGRYGWLNLPSGLLDQTRWTVGVNYWFDNASVLKLAFQRTELDGGEDFDALLLQVAFGF